MANWKIRDIAPPKSRKEKEEKKETPKEEAKAAKTTRRKRFPRWFSFGIPVVLVAVVAGVALVHVFFARAEIAVFPVTREIKVTERILAVVGQETLDAQRNTMPATTLQETQKATRLFPASSKIIKENKASGVIRVFNATSTPKTLIPQTRFVSEEGKLFRTSSRITIPAALGDTPGFLDTEVAAAEPGADYNIGPSNFSLPGLSGSVLFTAIYAKSTKSMAGGSEREVSVVSKEDIEAAKESLIAELSQKAKTELLSRIPENMMATEDSIALTVQEVSSLVGEGAELDQFNVTVSVLAKGFLLSKSDLNELSDLLLSKELQEGERLANERTKSSFESIALDQESGSASIGLVLDALAYQHVDPTELKIKLRGKSEEQAKTILKEYESVRESAISLWPFWISSIPGNVDKLEIQLVVD